MYHVHRRSSTKVPKSTRRGFTIPASSFARAAAPSRQDCNHSWTPPSRVHRPSVGKIHPSIHPAYIQFCKNTHTHAHTYLERSRQIKSRFGGRKTAQRSAGTAARHCHHPALAAGMAQRSRRSQTSARDRSKHDGSSSYVGGMCTMYLGSDAMHQPTTESESKFNLASGWCWPLPI